MSGVVNNKLLMYTDDSAILVADKHKSNIVKLLKKELNAVSDKLIDIKVSLHLGEPDSMVFCSKLKLKPQLNLRISCKDNDI